MLARATRQAFAKAHKERRLPGGGSAPLVAAAIVCAVVRLWCSAFQRFHPIFSRVKCGHGALKSCDLGGLSDLLCGGCGDGGSGSSCGSSCGSSSGCLTVAGLGVPFANVRL